MLAGLLLGWCVVLKVWVIPCLARSVEQDYKEMNHG